MAIESLRDISLASNVSMSSVLSNAYWISQRYRRYKIQKWDGGAREISVPYPSLLRIQKVINQEILKNTEIHPSAVGFRAGYSVIDHVKPHVGANRFAKFDIRDCFGSITERSVFNAYASLGYGRVMSHALTNLSVDNGSLPQGAATSPYLCNIILKYIDERLASYCNKLDLRYTRYADDLLISGDNLDLSIYRKLYNIVVDCGYGLNEKSRYMENPSRLIVCGISISGSDMKLPKSKKRAIRQAAYFLFSKSILDQSIKNEVYDPFYVDRVLGWLSYWAYVEPEADFPVRYKKIIKEKMSNIKN